MRVVFADMSEALSQGLLWEGVSGDVGVYGSGLELRSEIITRFRLWGVQV